MLSNRIRECCAALFKFATNAAGRLKSKQWMREGMIRNHVPAFLHFERNVRSLPNIPSDHEKRCRDVVLCKHVEQVQRVRIVWPIIKRKRNLL